MKFFLIAAIVLLALAQGSFAAEANIEEITQHFEDIKAKMAEMLGNPDLADHAETAIENSRKILEPMAAQVQEHLKSVATSMDEQIRPVANQMQAQIEPMIQSFKEKLEQALQKITEEVKTLQ